MANTNTIHEIDGSTTTELMISGVYQWDTGIKIKITNIESGSYTIQSACVGMATTIGSSPTTGTGYIQFQIPDSLLMVGRPVMCYVYKTESEASYTAYEITVDVTKRPKPSTSVYTDTQLAEYSTIMDAFNAELDNFNTNLSRIDDLEQRVSALEAGPQPNQYSLEIEHNTNLAQERAIAELREKLSRLESGSDDGE